MSACAIGDRAQRVLTIGHCHILGRGVVGPDADSTLGHRSGGNEAKDGEESGSGLESEHGYREQGVRTRDTSRVRLSTARYYGPDPCALSDERISVMPSTTSNRRQS